MSAIKVAVHADDPITKAGLTAHLASSRQFDLVTSQDGGPVSVIVVASVPVADCTTINLLRGRHAGRSRFCLVVEKGWDLDYSVAAEKGVRGVLWRTDATPDRLARLIRLVHEGKADFPADVQSGLLNHVLRIQRDVLAPLGLTSSGLQAREVDVLRWASEGFTVTEIARKMSYSERTVKNIFNGVIKRLNLRNRTQVVSYAIRAGLI
jgi:DNA-binding NarL/FixJ family response regulator